MAHIQTDKQEHIFQEAPMLLSMVSNGVLCVVAKFITLNTRSRL